MDWILKRYNSISVFVFIIPTLASYLLLLIIGLNASEVTGYTNYSLLAAFIFSVFSRRYGEKIDIFRHKEFERQTWIELAAQSNDYKIRRSAYLYIFTSLGLVFMTGLFFSGFVFSIFMGR